MFGKIIKVLGVILIICIVLVIGLFVLSSIGGHDNINQQKGVDFRAGLINVEGGRSDVKQLEKIIENERKELERQRKENEKLRKENEKLRNGK